MLRPAAGRRHPAGAAVRLPAEDGDAEGGEGGQGGRDGGREGGREGGRQGVRNSGARALFLSACCPSRPSVRPTSGRTFSLQLQWRGGSIYENPGGPFGLRWEDLGIFGLQFKLCGWQF